MFVSDLTITEMVVDIDEDSMMLLYEFVPGSMTFPVVIKGDGNCLPRCCSVYAFGGEQLHEEIRLLTAMEQILHKKHYLSEDYLIKGLPLNELRRKLFKPTYITQFSHSYLGDHFPSAVEHIYDQEILQIHQPSKFMGVWQLFALASVLRTLICSVYPKKDLKGSSCHMSIQ